MEHFFNLMPHLEFFQKYKEGPKANEGDFMQKYVYNRLLVHLNSKFDEYK